MRTYIGIANDIRNAYAFYGLKNIHNMCNPTQKMLKLILMRLILI